MYASDRSTLCILWISARLDSKPELAGLIRQEDRIVEISVAKTREMIIEDEKLINFEADEVIASIDHENNRNDWVMTMLGGHWSLSDS